ncbi:conserved hypothetical protein [Rubrivivax sp. A210]|uniref:hypothetical protein n=1 Tax=Rubrivivax sp. A210 TaxID=2772301 RepID=UPI00191B72EC|nr:hypothetical protein [Rubrivivax sp. A210]CAD5371587.1 conserved hypothetical protein [Rubrivivax sp. A210]
MSARWTTRLEARLGPLGLQLQLASRLPWRAARTLWRLDLPGVPTRAGCADALREALVLARDELGREALPWPRSLAIEIDDAWVHHVCLRGDFQSMSARAVADAAAGFFTQALGQPASELALCALTQPDGRSLWVAALPAALRQRLVETAAEAGLTLAALAPAAQRFLRPAARWPRDAVLALAHGSGVLLACRSGDSWIAMVNELRPFDAALHQRALALGRFHGLPPLEGLCWAAAHAGGPPLEGWQDARQLLGASA